MRTRLLVVGLVLATTAALTMAWLAMRLNQQMITASAQANAATRAAATAQDHERQVESAAIKIGDEAKRRQDADAERIRVLTGQLASSRARGVNTATPTLMAKQRTYPEALAYCRSLAAQAFPDSVTTTDPVVARLTNEYSLMQRDALQKQCMVDQGHP